MALFLVLVFLYITPKATGATRYTVYFYNPESNVDNFASLKTMLAVYLKDTSIASAGSEEYTMMELTTCRYILPNVGKVGVIYSKIHNKEWFQTALAEAAEVGIEVIGVPIEKDKEVKAALNTLLPTIDALWLISDPVVLAGTERVKEIFTLCDAMKKPVFAYDKLFANFSAALIISADIATMGKQAANNVLHNNESKEKSQNPAGSHIAINVKKLERYGILLNSKALSSVNEFIE